MLRPLVLKWASQAGITPAAEGRAQHALDD
jgi:hypothetical protein